MDRRVVVAEWSGPVQCLRQLHRCCPPLGFRYRARRLQRLPASANCSMYQQQPERTTDAMVHSSLVPAAAAVVRRVVE